MAKGDMQLCTGGDVLDVCFLLDIIIAYWDIESIEARGNYMNTERACSVNISPRHPKAVGINKHDTVRGPPLMASVHGDFYAQHIVCCRGRFSRNMIYVFLKSTCKK